MHWTKDQHYGASFRHMMQIRAGQRTLAEQVEDTADTFFLDAVDSCNVERMLYAASLYKKGNSSIIKSPYKAIALHTIATAYEDSGQASLALAEFIALFPENQQTLQEKKTFLAHAAAQDNKKALSFLSAFGIEAFTDPHSELFARVIRQQDAYPEQEKADYALRLLTGADGVKPQQCRAIAVAMLLAKRHPNGWHGNALMTFFADGKFRKDGNNYDQCILPSDFTLALRHAQKWCKLENNYNAVSLTWLGRSYRQLGLLEQAKKHLKEALQKQPTNLYALQELELTEKAIIAETKFENSGCCTIL